MITMDGNHSIIPHIEVKYVSPLQNGHNIMNPFFRSSVYMYIRK